MVVFARDMQFENCLACTNATSETFDFPVVLQSKNAVRTEAPSADAEDLLSLRLTLEPIAAETPRLIWKKVSVSVKPISVNLEDVMWRKLGAVLDSLIR